MDRKLKGIPVYAIVLILVSGTALGAGIWFLTVDVPVDYDEPVEITIYSERRDATNGDDYGGTGEEFRFRETHELTKDADLTYETYHQHIEFNNPDGGKEDLEITVELEVQPPEGEPADRLGFAIFSGEVDPVDVTWEYDTDDQEWDATDEETGETYRVERENDQFVTEDLDFTPLPANEIWTVIYTNKEYDVAEPGANYDIEGYEIQWDFFESAPQD